jgi:tRNA-Thr(GGU) m(6)t(6)A37 methyltransferase TsaA
MNGEAAMSGKDAQTEPPPWNQEVRLRPIGVVRCPRSQLTDDNWGAVTSVIEFDPLRLSADSLLGLDQFSHVEVIYFLHRVGENEVETGSRHPRDRLDWPRVGILAQRPKGRPNRLGVSCCQLQSVEGIRLTVRGLDAVDGTPVLDVKPYFREFGPRSEVRQPQWVADLMSEYYAE